MESINFMVNYAVSLKKVNMGLRALIELTQEYGQGVRSAKRLLADRQKIPFGVPGNDLAYALQECWAGRQSTWRRMGECF